MLILAIFFGRVSWATIWLVYQKVVCMWPLSGLFQMFESGSVSKRLILIRLQIYMYKIFFPKLFPQSDLSFLFLRKIFCFCNQYVIYKPSKLSIVTDVAEQQVCSIAVGKYKDRWTLNRYPLPWCIFICAWKGKEYVHYLAICPLFNMIIKVTNLPMKSSDLRSWS